MVLLGHNQLNFSVNLWCLIISFRKVIQITNNLMWWDWWSLFFKFNFEMNNRIIIIVLNFDTLCYWSSPYCNLYDGYYVVFIMTDIPQIKSLWECKYMCIDYHFLGCHMCHFYIDLFWFSTVTILLIRKFSSYSTIHPLKSLRIGYFTTIKA